MSVDGGWHIRVGDPSALGWFTVATYLVVTCLAYAVHSTWRDAAHRLNAFNPREAENLRLLAKLWLFVATVMLLLGINRQFALLSFFVEILRHFAQQEGWYADRYRYQAQFVCVILFFEVIGISLMLYWLRSVIRRTIGAVLALNFLLAFVIIRGSSYHPIDMIFYSGNPYWNLALEFGGLFAVAATALLARRAGQQSLTR